MATYDPVERTVIWKVCGCAMCGCVMCVCMWVSSVMCRYVTRVCMCILTSSLVQIGRLNPQKEITMSAHVSVRREGIWDNGWGRRDMG